jgi:hypothetical protein
VWPLCSSLVGATRAGDRALGKPPIDHAERWRVCTRLVDDLDLGADDRACAARNRGVATAEHIGDQPVRLWLAGIPASGKIIQLHRGAFGGRAERLQPQSPGLRAGPVARPPQKPPHRVRDQRLLPRHRDQLALHQVQPPRPRDLLRRAHRIPHGHHIRALDAPLAWRARGHRQRLGPIDMRRTRLRRPAVAPRGRQMRPRARVRREPRRRPRRGRRRYRRRRARRRTHHGSTGFCCQMRRPTDRRRREAATERERERGHERGGGTCTSTSGVGETWAGRHGVCGEKTREG